MAGDATGGHDLGQAGDGPPGLADAVAGLDPLRLAGERWFAGKARAVAGTTLAAAVAPPAAHDAVLALVDVVYDDGGVERYSMPVRLVEGTAVECSADDPLWRALAQLGFPGLDVGPDGRWLADDLSNTAVVLGEEVVVKLYRRPAVGTHPEAELLAALPGVPSVPLFHGRLDLGGATVLVVLGLVDGAPFAWAPLIARLAAGDGAQGEPGRIAAVVADLHDRLARALGTTPCSARDAGAAVARARDRLAESASSSHGVAELHQPLGRRLAALSLLAGSSLQRVHGDLHVGQVLSTREGYVVVDWEGDPDRSLDERRRPDTPLRDLASLLLSFDHAACAAARRTPGFDWQAWAASARAEALQAYEESAGAVDRQLLRALEIDKELAELAYATRFVPEWLYAPQAVLPTLARD